MPAQSNVTPISDRTLLPRSLIKRPQAPRGADQQWLLDGWQHLVSQIHALGETGAPQEEELRVVHAMDGMRAVAGSVRPQSPEVAILQLCLAIGELDAFDANWVAHPEGERMISLIRSLAENALVGFEDATGTSRAAVSGDYVAGSRPTHN